MQIKDNTNIVSDTEIIVQVASTLAIEEMFIGKDIIENLQAVTQKKKTINDCIKELDEIYDETNPYYFGEEMPDGRLTAEYDNTEYHFRDMLRKRNELGRPLTEDELKEFERRA